MRILLSLLLAAVVGLPSWARAAETTGSSITLTWTAPGDDGLIGTATRYDLRYSIAPITPQNFTLATQVSGVPVPGAPRSVQTFTVTSLAPSQRYYFAIRTADERSNWSAISNVVQKTAPSSPVDVPNSVVAISFSTPWPNPAGRVVRTLASGMQSSGETALFWDLADNLGHPVGAGVYLMHARLADRTFVKRLVVTR